MNDLWIKTKYQVWDKVQISYWFETLWEIDNQLIVRKLEDESAYIKVILFRGSQQEILDERHQFQPKKYSKYYLATRFDIKYKMDNWDIFDERDIIGKIG